MVACAFVSPCVQQLLPSEHEHSTLLQDTGQVVWGAFQGVVLRRLLDVIEPRVYICTRWTEERPTQTMVQSQHVVSLAIGVRVQEINRKRQPVGEDASFVGSADADGDQPSPGGVEGGTEASSQLRQWTRRPKFSSREQ